MDTQLDRHGQADLHMHTTASDGFAHVEAVLDHITRRTDLSVIAITDHDVLDASLWAYYHREFYPFDIVPGVEVSSADGHVLALWVTHPIPRKMSLKETVAAIHEQNGVAILAHPFEPSVSSRNFWRNLHQPDYVLEAGIDAIEAHNAAIPTPGSNRLARGLAARLGLPVVGGSDAHTLGGIASARTRFRGQTGLELREALARHETSVITGKWPMRDYMRYLPSCTQSKARLLAGALPRLSRF